ncbi:MAG TPA: Tex-like N-terminal domain-containing protein, partial [Spirochaetia bacterium]|nr:Tex-like N-terminal domain-containing protein [Spirochaetia bacterium]
MNLPAAISSNLSLPAKGVEAVLGLLDQDHTIPFIARYRKEATGALDEVELLAIRDERDRLLDLEKRRAAILESLAENGHLTPEREAAVRSYTTMTALEDFFLPFRPKRKTRASIALEKGLADLAEVLWSNQEPSKAVLERYLSAEKGVADTAEALSGAQDIVAERLAETSEVRRRLRERYLREGRLCADKARGAPSDHPFVDHLGKSEALSSMPGHRLLALLRGESEKFLSLSLEVDPVGAEADVVLGAFPRGTRPVAALTVAVKDSLKRLLGPSIENETMKEARERAEAGAIGIFAENLRQLLLAAPLGQKALLAVDPGLRTGCKVVVLSAQGALLDHGVIYPLEPHRKTAEAEKLVRSAVTKYHLGAVAVGNGTGGRESEAWLKSLNLGIPVLSVNESGASVYSASEVAREEFPDHDLTVRGAVSIGRRLMDP